MKSFFVGLFSVVYLSGMAAIAGVPTTHTITVRWTAPGDDGYSGKAYRYDIRFSTAPITAANWNQASRSTEMPLPATPGLLQTCTVYGLVPNTKYYFRMKTADEKYNWSALSNEISITTCGGVCADTPGNVDCSPDNIIDIADLTVLIQYLYVTTDPMCLCLAEANVDADPLKNIDISDLTRLTDYLYISRNPISPCP